MNIPENHPLIIAARKNGMLVEPMFRKTEIKDAIIVPMPPTTNNLFTGRKGGGRRKSDEYQEWCDKTSSVFCALKPPAEYPVEICIVLLPGAKWRSSSDASNRIKALEDAIVAAGVLPNDNTKYVSGVRIAIGGEPDRSKPSMAAVWLAKSTIWWSDVTLQVAKAGSV